MDMYSLLGKLVVLISFVGVASALECIVCSWNVENGSVEDNCLGAPFKTNISVCPKSNSPGERIVCETRATYNRKLQSLERLERKCSSKHAKCNNACADDISNCWLCCSDNDKCNGFPLSTNVVLTSSADEGSPYLSKCVVLATMWLYLSIP